MGKAEKAGICIENSWSKPSAGRLAGSWQSSGMRFCRGEKEAIYEAAYQIDSIISIYELLAEMSGRLLTETLEAAVMFPNILAFLYREWLGYEDSYTADIQYCLDKELAKLRRDYRDRKEENMV